MSTMSHEIAALGLSVSMAIAAGLIGCFAVMRRLTVAADPMSHVALPGIAVALLLHLNPLAGALLMLLLGALLIWVIERRSRLATETVIGVVFAVALAVGTALAKGDELIDAMLGSPGALSGGETVLGISLALGVIAFVLRTRYALIVSLVSPEIAMTSGVDVSRVNLYFLLAFALTIGLGLRYLGVLLMGSLIIIPAAIARRLARGLNQMFVIAAASAVISTVSGAYAASIFGRQSGPFIVMIAGTLFFLTLFRR